MKKLATVVMALSCVVALHGQTTRERLTDHVYTLSADSLEGRKFGTPAARISAEWIAAQFAAIGLESYKDDSYIVPFAYDNQRGNNVIGVLRGSDPALRDEWIVLGAHFDHVGVSQGRIHPGADANASGTAVLVEVARNLAARQGELRRSVIFAAFDAEEQGLVGSTHLAKNLPEGKVKLMASIDMVGWLRESKALKISGVAMLKGGKDLFAEANGAVGLALDLRRFDTSIMLGSDHDPFAQRGIPAILVTTGTKSPYHKPEDTADKIDYEGLTAVTGYMTDVTASAAGRDRLESSGRSSFKHGREPRIAAGITAAIGSNRHHYDNGALEGKNAFAWNAGLYARINFGNWALRPKVVYEERSAMWPVNFEERASARFSTGGIYVPLDLMYKLRPSADMETLYFYLFAGGYYSRTITKPRDAAIDPSAHGAMRLNEGGMQWGVGLHIYKFWMESTSRYSLSEVFGSGGIRNYSSYFSVGYKF
jgi:hypothetical protein